MTFSGADDVSSVDKAAGFTYEYSVDNGGVRARRRDPHRPDHRRPGDAAGPRA